MMQRDFEIQANQELSKELENVMININTQPSMEVLSSGLWSAHLTSNQSTLQPLAVASAYLVQDLCRRYHDSENLVQKLKVIGQNARGGYYTTIRKLELELIQTGKVGRTYLSWLQLALVIETTRLWLLISHMYSNQIVFSDKMPPISYTLANSISIEQFHPEPFPKPVYSSCPGAL